MKSFREDFFKKEHSLAEIFVRGECLKTFYVFCDRNLKT